MIPIIRSGLVLFLATMILRPPLLAQDGPTAGANTALDRYVAAPDDAYAWKLVHSAQQNGATTYVLDMKSQSWRKPSEVDRTVWQHWLTIVKPDSVKSNKTLLFVGGGSNGRAAPQSANERTRLLALSTNSVVVELGMIPNQPLVFHNDGHRRKEDDLIGYAWDQFMKTSDPLWLPRLPMVKAVVRAMDTTQTWLASEQGGRHTIDQFVIAGGSKRGWTTWMTAAVDSRVCAIMPIVIDVLNVKPSMEHHYAAYGFWAPAINDYVRHKITHRRDAPEHARLLELVDPYAYRARFTMPKCLINATGDQFFLPDSSQFYFDDLPDEKHLTYVPNAGHSLRGSKAMDTIIAFHHAIVNDTPRPKFSWEFDGADTIRVVTQTRPKQVLLWQATNPNARDFRIDTIGPAYKSAKLSGDGKGVYTAKVEVPEQGWTAYFAQLEFDVGAPTTLRLTTPVRVVPESLPHADKTAPRSE